MNFTYKIFTDIIPNEDQAYLPILFVPEDSTYSSRVVRLPKNILTEENFEEIVLNSAPLNDWEFERECREKKLSKEFIDKYSIPTQVSNEKMLNHKKEQEEKLKKLYENDIIPASSVKVEI